jgi:hypothetical protein
MQEDSPLIHVFKLKRVRRERHHSFHVLFIVY